MGAGRPVAFMCYARFNDVHDDGQLTTFRKQLAAEVQVQTGDEFPIFQDRADIAWGENWQRRIEEALDEVTILLVIITPGLFRSQICRREVERFAARERALGRDDLILPVYYVSTPEMEDPKRRDSDELAMLLASRQLADWRELRFELLTSPVARKAIAGLASRMTTAFWRRPASMRPSADTRQPKATVTPEPPGARQGDAALATVKAWPPSTSPLHQPPPMVSPQPPAITHRRRPRGDAGKQEAEKDVKAAIDEQARSVLMSDAEHIAQLITDKRQKAVALATVARARAANEPEDAGRLMGDAERTVRLISDQSRQARAFAEIAEVLAAIDPGYAEHIALSISVKPSKPSRRRHNVNDNDYELADIVQALAPIDPDRAERIVQVITSKTCKSLALTNLLRALAATDPDRAERIAQDMEPAARNEGLGDIAEVLATADPDRAERIAQSLPDDWSGSNALAEVAKARAATDPDRAERIARGIHDPSAKNSALADIAQILAAGDPDGAERIAGSITSNSWKASALALIAKVVAVTDRDHATRLLESAESFARGTSDGRASPLSKIAGAMAVIDPDRAERIARSITSDFDRDYTLVKIAQVLAATDLDHAERIARSFTDTTRQGTALIRITEALVATDPERAERFARSISDEFSKVMALIVIAES